MEYIDFEKAGKEDDERNYTFQNNQIAILLAIDSLMRKNERLPTQIEIAGRAGLSRVTLNVHLREYRRCDMLSVELQQLEAMGGKALARLLKEAIDGNMQAMRLWLMVTGVIGKKAKDKKGE